VYTLISGGLSR